MNVRTIDINFIKRVLHVKTLSPDRISFVTVLFFFFIRFFIIIIRHRSICDSSCRFGVFHNTSDCDIGRWVKQTDTDTQIRNVTKKYLSTGGWVQH